MAKKKPVNRRRSIFVDDETWAQVEARAKTDARSSASWIRQAIIGALALPG